MSQPTETPGVWIGFAMMCLGMFMAILDVQVVATSIPSIEAALSVPADQMSWVQTAYLIAEVIAIPLTGLLTRVLTMRWLFVGAVAVFTLASVGCASSTGFGSLIGWRIVQGFAGGTLIPAVFAAVFLLFPVRRQGLATTIAGVLAVLAPTVGPIVGGWITETWSWHWLFLINVLPGLVAAGIGAWFLPRATVDWGEGLRLDIGSLVLMALALAGLVLGLKEAPGRGWVSPVVLSLFALSLATFLGFFTRTAGARFPVVQLRTFGEPGFGAGCVLSFVLGIGLFGSVYMMPVFLAVAHGYGAFAIGKVMLVTGIAQLVTAPVAVELEKRVDPRALSAFGFVLFAAGLAMSARATPETGYDEMFWPQVVRGVAIMFCLLPPTRIALGYLAPEKVADASGLFNLVRNLGGAIGLAMIDTVIFGRAPVLAEEIVARLMAGDRETAAAVGIPLDLFAAQQGQPVDAGTQALLAPMVEKLAFTGAMNEAWAMVAGLTLAAVLALAFVPARRV